MNIKKEVVVQSDPKAPVAEVFRTLKTNIQFMGGRKKSKTFLITSTLPGEGKSWVSANLAVTFAKSGNKVILIDADMRKGRQHSIFGVAMKPGLSNYLSKATKNQPNELNILKYIQKTDVENLLIMSSGSMPQNPSELLVSNQMERILEELKEVSDIIIIDGTACALVSDSIILSRIVDSTVIVTAHKETKKENLMKTVKNINNVGGHLVGVVMNKMPEALTKYDENYYSTAMVATTTTAREKASGIKKKAGSIIKQNPEMIEEPELEKQEIKIKVESKKENIDLEVPDFIAIKQTSKKIKEENKDT